MIKKYFIQPLSGLQVGDLVRYDFPHKPVRTERHGSLGLIIDINTETNASFDHQAQAVVNNEHTVYTVFWQKEIPGYPSESFETEKYLQLVWSNEKQNELASQIGLYDCENDMAGSVGFKYQERK